VHLVMNGMMVFAKTPRATIAQLAQPSQCRYQNWLRLN